MKKRVAIVGFGNRARHYYNELRRSEHFELAAIFDGVQNNEIYGRIPFYDNINDLLDSVQIDALIVTDTHKYLNLIPKCLNFIKFILLDPWLCKSGEIRELKYCFKSQNIGAYVAFIDRFNPVIASVKKELAKEKEIFSLNIARGFNKGVNLQLEILQNIDAVRFVTGSEIVFSNKILTQNEDKRSETDTLFQLKFKNQTLASIHNSKRFRAERFTIEFAASGGVYFGDILGLKLNKYTADGQQNLKVYSDLSPVKAMLGEFYQACCGAKNDLSTLEDALKAQEICE